MRFPARNLFRRSFVFSVTLAWVSQAPAGEPREWRVEDGGNGHFYAISDGPGSWFEKNLEAQLLGGHLVSIHSDAENDFVHSLTLGTGREYHWIGLTDEAVEGTFVWTSGEPFTYSRWYMQEPNNLGNEDQVEFVTSLGAWNDKQGINIRHGLVEWSSDPNKEEEPPVKVSVCGSIDGKCRNGNSVLIKACVEPEDASPEVQKVQFNYRQGAEGPWLPIPAANVNHPNPDAQYPFFVHWWIEDLPPADYQVRAVATTLDGREDMGPETAVFTIPDENCGYQGMLNGDGELEIETTLESSPSSTPTFSDIDGPAKVTLSAPPGSSAAGSLVNLIFRQRERYAASFPVTLGFDYFVEIESSSGKSIPTGGDVLLSMFYRDEDGDGILDGTGFEETSLALYRLQGPHWHAVAGSESDPDSNRFSATVDGNGVYAVLPAGLAVEEWESY